MKILYIGAGEHFDVINHFSNCNEFVLIDSKPMNDYGFEYYYRPFYRPNFVENITLQLKQFGFNLADSKILTNNFTEITKPFLESTKLTFTNVNQLKKITYFISTCITTHLSLEDLINELKTCDTIIVSGHAPHLAILDYLPIPHTFIGYSDTCYPKPTYILPTSKDNLDYIDTIANSHYNKNDKIISSYIMIDNKTENKKTFQTYKAFYDYHCSLYHHRNL